MAARDGDLGAFLRARRDELTPADVGISAGPDRRVSGLRREEVALLAGVSTDYYRRLEQGREFKPSAQVLRALARALQMDPYGTAYLIGLVHPLHGKNETPPELIITAGTQLLLDKGLHVPALVVGPALDILGMNSYASALYSGFSRRDNIAHMVFLDSCARDFYIEWDQVASQVVANLRAGLISSPHDRSIATVVGELSVRSPLFASLWATHRVRPRTSEDKRFCHPELGEIFLHFEAMEITDRPTQRLFVYCPYEEDSTDSTVLLRYLADEQSDRARDARFPDSYS